MAVEELNSVVVHRMQVSPSMFIVRVAPKGWELPEFSAGQFIVLGMPPSTPRCSEATEEQVVPSPEKMVKRAYSIASSSQSREYIEFYITLVRGGALTPRLYDLQVGDSVWMGKKCTGMFTLNDVASDADVVLVATGTGVAPYMSMLRSDIMNGKRRIAVIHGASNSWDLGYSSELTMLDSLHDNFTYIPTITEPDAEPIPWRGDVRFVQDMWTGNVVGDAWGEKPTPENTHVFLCGNPVMTDAMVEVLEQDGFIEHSRKQPGQIHVERF